MSTILITGGTGFVGGRIARRLGLTNNVIVSSRKVPEPALLEAHGVAGYVLHHSLLLKDSFPRGIDVVIHLAALNEWDCVTYPSEAIKVNIDETRIILENAIAAGARRFIYFSTAHVYGSPLKGVITEETLPIPVHPYAITHKAAEDYVVAAGLQKKISSTVFRLSNSFGAPVVPAVNRWTLLTNDLARQVAEKGNISLLSNGCQYRDFICLTDVENIIAALLERDAGLPEHSIYNLGSGQAMRVLDMAKAIAGIQQRLTGKNIEVSLPPGAVPSEEPFLYFDVGRLKSEGFTLDNPIEQELEQLLLFCQLNFTA